MCLETPSSGRKPSEEAVSRSEGGVAISMTLISTTHRVPAMKPVGKPDAGNPHVRFDERGWETGRCQGVSYRAHPRLYRMPLARLMTGSVAWRRIGTGARRPRGEPAITLSRAGTYTTVCSRR